MSCKVLNGWTTFYRVNHFVSLCAAAAADVGFAPSPRSMRCRPSMMRIDDAVDYARDLLPTGRFSCGEIPQLRHIITYLIDWGALARGKSSLACDSLTPAESAAGLAVVGRDTVTNRDCLQNSRQLGLVDDGGRASSEGSHASLVLLSLPLGLVL
jgi:hypothetical protein